MNKGEWIKLDPPERLRSYVFSNHKILEIKDVSRVKISNSGNHYIETKSGERYIVAPGWLYIQFDMDKWTF